MRACGGCRRRKIKCDAATTNTWPCSACTRLKLQCDPPTLGQDRDFTGIGYGELDVISTPTNINPPTHEFPSQNVPVQHYYPHVSNLQAPTSSAGYIDSHGSYQAVTYPPRIQTQQNIYHDIAPIPGALPDQHTQHQQPIYYPSHPQTIPDGTPTSPDGERLGAEGLSDALGELKIDDVGIGTTIISYCSTTQLTHCQSTVHETAK